MKKFTRFLGLLLTAVLMLGLFSVPLTTIASAATVYQLPQLLSDGKIKPLGRTQTNLAGDGITADWSGTGFDINVSGIGGTLTVGYKASYTAYWAILVDDVQVWRGYAASGTGSFGATIPAGTHTVRVIKETQISSAETAYYDLTTLTFDGTIEAAPANKSLYIECIGASTMCGDGALGEYEPGVKWLGAHDSASHGYPYYLAKKLNADYSIVARGGIGLFAGVSAQEGTSQKKGIQEIYPYVSGYNQENGEYDFARKPDMVLITIGGNDTLTATNTITYWKELLNGLIDLVREKYPDAHIVLNNSYAPKYKAMLEVWEARRESDPKLHTFHYTYMGNGSAALTSQYKGHPDYKDLELFAQELAEFMWEQDIIPTYEPTPSYTDIPYFVSENGSDDNDGKTIETAKKTLNAAVNQARTDYGTFAAGSRLVVYIQGVVNGANNKQGLLSGGVLTDVNGERVPTLVTTYNYTGTKAVLNTGHAAINDGNGFVAFYNDVTLKDIIFQSTTNAASGYRDRYFYSGYGSDVVLDNVTFDMNGETPRNNYNWCVATGTALGTDVTSATGKQVSSITFKNGDYTNLALVTTTMNDKIWKSDTENVYDVPDGDFRIIIEDGAIMGKVFNRYGSLNVGKTSVTINGGIVNQYVGTKDGTASERMAYKGDINLTINGGEIYGTHFSTAGMYVDLEGDINTTINGGIFRIIPQDNVKNYDGYFFGGRRKCVVEDINTTITGGQFYLIVDVADIDTAFYFGVTDGGTAANITNKISGGVFMPYARGAVGKECHIYLGVRSGNVTGTLRNEITGGTFQFGLSGLSDRAVVIGSRGVNWPIGKIENVFGSKDNKFGPDMSSGILRMAGTWAQVGETTKQTTMPTTCSDTVVVSNTIYGGCYGTIYMGSSSVPSLADGYYTYIKGSIENNIYGGFFLGNVYCGGNGPVYGHVKTNVYGGFFKSIYGGSNTTSTIYDGVELNIYGLEEYYPVNPNDNWVFCGGSASGKVPVPMTEGRDAIKFTISPAKANELVLNTRLKVGNTDGKTSVAISGGTFPRGFAVEGIPVSSALASGSAVFDYATGGKATYGASDTAISGAVVVDRDGESYTNHLEYYVSEFGQDAFSGTSPVTPKKTLRAVFAKIKTDNGNSTQFPKGTRITIYVEGTVENTTASERSQMIGGGTALSMNTVRDHVPVTITTYGYDGTNKAKIIQDYKPTNIGNATTYVVNDLYFKDIDLQSVTNPDNGYCVCNFYASGCAVTFDNCSITTDGNATKNGNAWNIGADHFYNGGFDPFDSNYQPHVGSVTFKNGDYTNLARVSAVNANNIWRTDSDGGILASAPQMTTKVIIEDGAHMGRVYNCFGTLAVGSATVEIRGGTVEQFCGTQNGFLSGTTNTVFTYNVPEIHNIVTGGTVNSFYGTGAGYHNTTENKYYFITINGNVTNTISGGTVKVSDYSGSNSYVTINGNLTNNFAEAEPDVAALVVAGQQIARYGNFADAAAEAAKTDAVVYLLADVETDCSVDGDLWVDLNGFDLSGITVTGTVYGMDSATNGYTAADAGKLTLAAGTVAASTKTNESQIGAIRRYLAIPEEGGYSFHRFYFGITHISMDPATAGIGYRDTFAGSKAVKNYLDASAGFGMVASVEGVPADFDDGVAVAFAAKDFALERGTVSKRVLIQNVLEEGLSKEELEQRAQTVVSAVSFLKTKNGDVILSSCQENTFRAMVEAIDTGFYNFTKEQQDELLAFYEKFSEVAIHWDLLNLFKEVPVVPDKLVALTFDDAPSSTTMKEMLDVLAKYDAKGTFFVSSFRINESTLPVLKRAYAEGHEIGNHGVNHVHMDQLSDEEIYSEFYGCQQAIKEAIGIEPIYFRAPYGGINDKMYEIIQAPFIRTGTGAKDGTIGSSAEERAALVVNGVYDGCIVGMHCFGGNTESVKALEIIIPKLRAQGYEFVTVSELFTKRDLPIPVPTPGKYYIDNKPLA